MSSGAAGGGGGRNCSHRVAGSWLSRAPPRLPGGVVSGRGRTGGMDSISHAATDVSPATSAWGESTVGPSTVVPVSTPAAWRWCTESGVVAGGATAPDDCDRACAVEGPAGVIAVGESGAQPLVPADEPATGCCLPEQGVFLRWLGAGSEVGLKAAVEAVLAHSGEAGAELGAEYPGGGFPAEEPVPLPAGRWRVRAVRAEADEGNRVGRVHLISTGLST